MAEAWCARIVRFGLYEVDLRTGEVRKDGIKLKLQGQPFQVLAALLERPSDVVTREELRQRIWPAQTFVDFDRGLNKAINKLRDALGDQADNPRFVETLARRGYRFIAPLHSREAGAGAPAPKLRLVVLPFENLSTDPDQEYFSEGLAEELTTQLGRMNPQKLGVIARSSAMQYKGTGKTIEQIGQELRVDYVLEGSVRRAGSRVRITVQLIQAQTQTHLWAESYDRELKDIFAIQDEVAGRVGTSLACELLPGENASQRSTTIPAALEAYMRGRHFWNRRSESALKSAIECFQRALEEDSGYALAHAGLAECYAMLGWYGALSPQEAGGRARAAASQALELDENLGEGFCALGLLRFWYEWEWRGAEECFRRAVDLNPSQAIAHHWYASFLAAMGRIDDARAQQARAQELDPLSLAIAKSAGDTYYYQRNYDKAIEHYRGVLQREPRFIPAHFDLGRAYLQKGRHEEALVMLKQALLLSGNREAGAALAQAHAAAGQSNEADTMLSALLKPLPERYTAAPPIALVYMAMGETGRALGWLERGFEERSPWMVFLKMDPAYDPLRAEPRFAQLLQRMGL